MTKGGSRVRPNSPERYNAQPYRAEPMSHLWEAKMRREGAARARRWYNNPKNAGLSPPGHIIERAR